MSGGNADEILAKIASLLARWEPDSAKITSETKLDADLNIDSAAAMELIMEIEDGFDIDININQVGELHSVGDLVAMVQNEIGKGA